MCKDSANLWSYGSAMIRSGSLAATYTATNIMQKNPTFFVYLSLCCCLGTVAPTTRIQLYLTHSVELVIIQRLTMGIYF